MKKMVIALGVVAVMSGSAIASEYGTDGRDVAAGVGLTGGWGAAVATNTSYAVVQASPVLYQVFGIIAGPIREMQTDPAKRGLSRYNGQALDEDSKWELDPQTGGRWKRLKGYASNENVLAKLDAQGQADLETHDSKKFVRTSQYGFMERK